MLFAGTGSLRTSTMTRGRNAYVSLLDMKAHLDEVGLAYVLHTTTKSRAGWDRYRLLLPLKRPIEAGEFCAAWASANERFNASLMPELMMQAAFCSLLLPGRVAMCSSRLQTVIRSTLTR